MYNSKIRKLIGSFIFVLAICLLLLSLFGINNKAEHINEYHRCIIEYETSPVVSENLLIDCKENASDGLGITLRQSQLQLTTSQYMYVYLLGLINVLIAVTLLIIGKILYTDVKDITKLKTKPVKKTLRKRTRRKK